MCRYFLLFFLFLFFPLSPPFVFFFFFFFFFFFLTNVICPKEFKNASAFLLRGARHAIHDILYCAPCKSTLRFGRRKTIVHLTMRPAGGYISWGLTPTDTSACFSPPIEVGVISQLIYNYIISYSKYIQDILL